MTDTYNTEKKAWIKEQHDKAVKIHHANIHRISELNSKISTATRRIAVIQKSISLLDATVFEYEEVKYYSKKEEKIFAKCDHTQYWDHDSNARMFAEDYSIGTSELHERQKQLCIDVAKWQKEIDTNPWNNSCEIMHRDSDEEMLAEKYDKLIKATGTQILKEIKDNEEVA